MAGPLCPTGALSGKQCKGHSDTKDIISNFQDLSRNELITPRTRKFAYYIDICIFIYETTDVINQGCKISELADRYFSLVVIKVVVNILE